MTILQTAIQLYLGPIFLIAVFIIPSLVTDELSVKVIMTPFKGALSRILIDF